MKAGNFKVIPLLILVITSLVASTLVLTTSKVKVANTLKAAVYPDVDNIFVLGKDTAYSYNNSTPAPIKTYVTGDGPPMMMADQIGSGRVVASGDITEARGTISGSTYSDNFAALTDAIFRWLAPGRAPSDIYVLWYNGYGVYCTSSSCPDLITKLGSIGYTITGDPSMPITSDMLAPYDILVLPEMQLGNAKDGGDPTLLPDADVAAINSFVQGGKGLLIFSGSDFFGPGGTSGKGNYYKVMNKVLINLGFGYGGRLFGFQSDSVYDDVNNSKFNTDVPTPGGDSFRPIVDVNINHPIGAAYQAATGRNTIRAYGGCSLVQLGKGMSVYIQPEFQVGMPGDTLRYKFKIYNTGVPVPGIENVDLTLTLTANDASSLGWSPILDNNSITVAEGDNHTVTMRVTIPSSAHLSDEDKITLTASASGISQSLVCIAQAGKRLEATADALVESDKPLDKFGENLRLVVGQYENTTVYNTYLKFSNLGDIPSGASITEARLYLFAWHAYGSPGGAVCKAVDDDSWEEIGANGITWDTKPTPGSTLDTLTVSIASESQPTAYSWDVTSYVRSQFAGDQTASFCLLPAADSPLRSYRYYDSREWDENRLRPFLMVVYPTATPTPKVSVSISPNSRSGLPGKLLSYTVTVKNEGNVSDTYSLTTADNAVPSWGPTISSTPLSLAAGAQGTATLTVTIPSNANVGAIDNVRVIVTGTSVSTETSCTAQASNLAVEVVSILPTPQDGSPGAALTYTVTVKNTGVVADNYVLTKSDNAGWTLSLSPSTLSLAENALGNATLTVTIPTGAGNNVYDSVTVTATSQTDSSVSDSKSCTAHSRENRIPGVQVTISPASSSGNPGGTLHFSVTVTNTGTTTDTFTLDASDTKGWGTTLSVTPPRVTLTAGASRTIGLSIKISSTAAKNDSSTITVTATSQTNSTINDDNTCTATAAAPGGGGGGISPLVYVGVAIVIIVAIVVIVVVRPF
jgi:uncharacterized membrane protein